MRKKLRARRQQPTTRAQTTQITNLTHKKLQHDPPDSPRRSQASTCEISGLDLPKYVGVGMHALFHEEGYEHTLSCVVCSLKMIGV
jgi:hypothetical protein